MIASWVQVEETVMLFSAYVAENILLFQDFSAVKEAPLGNWEKFFLRAGTYIQSVVHCFWWASIQSGAVIRSLAIPSAFVSPRSCLCQNPEKMERDRETKLIDALLIVQGERTVI